MIPSCPVHGDKLQLCRLRKKTDVLKLALERASASKFSINKLAITGERGDLIVTLFIIMFVKIKINRLQTKFSYF